MIRLEIYDDKTIHLTHNNSSSRVPAQPLGKLKMMFLFRIARRLATYRLQIYTLPICVQK